MYMEVMALCIWRSWACVYGGHGLVYMEVMALCIWRSWACVYRGHGPVYMEVMDLCVWRTWACVYGGSWAEQLVIHLSENHVQSKKLVSCAGDSFFLLVRLIRFLTHSQCGLRTHTLRNEGRKETFHSGDPFTFVLHNLLF